MKTTVKQGSLVEAQCDALVVNLFQGVTSPGGGTGAVDRALDGQITRLIQEEQFDGKEGRTAVLHTYGRISASKVILVGLGRAEEFSIEGVRRATSYAARTARDLAAKKVSTILHGAGIGGLDAEDCARAIAEGSALGTYKFIRHKTEPDRKALEEVEIVEMDASKIAAIEKGAREGDIIADAVIFARDLVNEPGNVATPIYLAEAACEVAEDSGLEYRVLEREDMERLGMGLFLAVAKGSEQPPKLVFLKYNAPGAEKTIAFVGKGITFDTGGISLKPAEGMENMKDDMSGSAAVLAALRAVPLLAPKVSVIGILALTENMPSGRATRPGDIVKAMTGKTVEINNTDAEGRLVLGDAVAYAEREGADEIIDVATLTGACVVALGRGISGIFSRDSELICRLIAAGAAEGEVLWELPLHKDYKDMLKSEYADIKNAPGRDAGAITGALFIGEFVGKGKPWAHIDIAGPSFVDHDYPLSPKGGTGAGTATLVGYLRQLAR